MTCAACGLTCRDRPTVDCEPCWDAAIDAEMDRAVEAERDARCAP